MTEPLSLRSRDPKETSMTKREADFVESIVRSMTERDYWTFISWLRTGARDQLWGYVRMPQPGDQLPRAIEQREWVH